MTILPEGGATKFYPLFDKVKLAQKTRAPPINCPQISKCEVNPIKKVKKIDEMSDQENVLKNVEMSAEECMKMMNSDECARSRKTCTTTTALW